MGITHETKIESLEQVDKETAYKNIINVLISGYGYTAREIATELYEKKIIPYPVRQAVAPRLTELEDAGIVKVIGKTYDTSTKRNVAVYKLVEI